MSKNSLYFVFVLLFVSSALAENSQVERLHQQCYELLDSNLDSAYLIAEQANLIAAEDDDRFLQAQSIFIQAYILRVQDKMGESFAKNLDALKLLNDLTTDKAITTQLKLLVNTGEILEHHYAFDQAIYYYNRGIDLALKYGKSDRLVNLYYNKAVAAQINKETEKALESVENAIDLALKLDNEVVLVESMNLKGLILIEMEEFEESRQIFQGIIQYTFKNENRSRSIGNAWHNVGHSYGSEGKWQLANEAYQKALPYRSESVDSKGMFVTYLDLTEVNYFLDNYREADRFGNLAEQLYDQADLQPENYRLFDLRSKIALKEHNSPKAFEYVQRYYQENMSFLQIQSELLKTRSQYKMEVLTAGFFNSGSHNNDHTSLLEYLAWLAGLSMFALILSFRIKNWLVKRSIERELIKIDNESIV